MTKSLCRASNKLSLFDNFYVLIEDSDDAGRAFLARNVRKTLIQNIAQLLELIDGAQPGLIGIRNFFVDFNDS